MDTTEKKDIIARLIALGIMIAVGIFIYALVVYVAKTIAENRKHLEAIQQDQIDLVDRCLEAGGIPSVRPKYQTGRGWISNKLERCDFPK